MNEKITHQHSDKTAYIYVRQSTVHQVRHHHQGRQRQYDLSDRARQLGFAQVVVIDDDQGKTGSGLVERPGFATLLTAVCGGRAGAVFALEASRLARNNRDWHHLIDLCALTSTLIIDGEGIYDPKQVNDRLLLGLKGTMSEFELSLFRQRARKAFEMKVAAGHAMWEIPIGYTRDESDRIERVADRQIQTAIAGVFTKFRELGSARQTALWYRDQAVSLPEAVRGTRSRQANWRLPSVSRIRQVLKNPCYAGALAYGRTEAKVSVDNGRARKNGTRTAKPQDKWKVLLRENHEGYITWQEYEENLKMLNANTAARQPTASGKAKNGSALLGGLLRCAHCGRKLFVGYSGSAGSVQRYNCNGGREERGSAACQSLGGIDVDRAISDALLETIAPAGIEAALLAMEKFDTQKDQRCQSLELALEKARFEVDRARRQYDEVDPANRLVAGELETRWNKALENVAKLELQLQELQLIGKEHFAIDGCKLPSDASKQWSGTHDELRKKSEKMKKAAQRIIDKHQDGDNRKTVLPEDRKQTVETLLSNAQKIDDFLADNEPRTGAGKSQKEVKSNITDNESAKMTTSKGTIQGFNAVTAADEKHQIIISAEAYGAGAEQFTLAPTIESIEFNLNIDLGNGDTVVTADTGFSSEQTMAYLFGRGIDAVVPDNQFRQRQEAFAESETYIRHKELRKKTRPDRAQSEATIPSSEFKVDLVAKICICPAGKEMMYHGEREDTRGRYSRFRGKLVDCRECALSKQCMRNEVKGKGRQVQFLTEDQTKVSYIDLMKQKIDSEEGARQYSRRMWTIEPVFANICSNKGLDKFGLRGKEKVTGQWRLFAMVHNLEKLWRYGPEAQVA